MQKRIIPEQLCLEKEIIQTMNDKLDEIQLNELFEESKRLLNETSNGIISEEQMPIKSRLTTVYRHVFIRLSSRVEYDIRTYVGFLSILSFIRSSAKHFCISLNFQKNFYRNLNKKANELNTVWNKFRGTQQQEVFLICLSTFLFILCSFTQKNDSNPEDLNVEKVFNKNLVKIIINLKLPNNTNILKHYKTILLYIYKTQPKLLSTSQALDSITSNLSNSPFCSNSEMAFVYILLKTSYKNTKENKTNLCSILPKLRDLILENSESPCFSLVMKLIGKVIQKYPQEQSLFTTRELYTIIQPFLSLKQKLSEISPTILKLIASLQKNQKAALFETAMNSLSFTIGLELLQICSKSINPQIYIKLIQSGFWGRILDQLMNKQKTNNYRKSLLSSLVENLLNKNLSYEIQIALKNNLNIIPDSKFIFWTKYFLPELK